MSGPIPPCAAISRRSKAANSDDAKTVIAKMREMPVNDGFAQGGKLRPDGRMVHDVYLVQIKAPAESHGEWDLLKLVATIPGDKAFRPLAEGGCPPWRTRSSRQTAGTSRWADVALDEFAGI